MSKHQIQPDIWRMGRLARDVMAETVSRDQIFGREQEEENCSLFSLPRAGVDKIDALMNRSILIPEKAALVTRTTLRTTCLVPPYFGSETIGTQLRDLTNWGLVLTASIDAVADSGRNLASKHQIQLECSECAG